VWTDGHVRTTGATMQSITGGGPEPHPQFHWCFLLGSRRCNNGTVEGAGEDAPKDAQRA
jgi:hypothetical protein